MAGPLTCKPGHMDQLGDAVKAFQDAQAAVPTAQERAKELVADARAKVEETRRALADSIAREYGGGARVGDLARRTGYNRESIRRILRAAGFTAE